MLAHASPPPTAGIEKGKVLSVSLLVSFCGVLQVEGETYQLKPMNCPFHVEIYKNGYYSYRDLPLRWAELGTVYRYERSGAMQGLFRVRGFTQVHAFPPALHAHPFCFLPHQSL